MSQHFKNRNEAGKKREDFFQGLIEMIKQFSQQDVERLRTIIFNEIRSRRNESDKSKGKFILPIKIRG